MILVLSRQTTAGIVNVRSPIVVSVQLLLDARAHARMRSGLHTHAHTHTRGNSLKKTEADLNTKNQNP